LSKTWGSGAISSNGQKIIIGLPQLYFVDPTHPNRGLDRIEDDDKPMDFEVPI
jgi:hypothetical protein